MIRAAHSRAIRRLEVPAIYSIEPFCRTHSISRSKPYAMLRAGERPRIAHFVISHCQCLEMARAKPLAARAFTP
jgi:hypothetical protein